jgi:hypothetical protein
VVSTVNWPLFSESWTASGLRECRVKTRQDVALLLEKISIHAESSPCCICLEPVIYPIVLPESECHCPIVSYCGPCFANWIWQNGQQCACCRHPFSLTAPHEFYHTFTAHVLDVCVRQKYGPLYDRLHFECLFCPFESSFVDVMNHINSGCCGTLYCSDCQQPVSKTSTRPLERRDWKRALEQHRLHQCPTPTCTFPACQRSCSRQEFNHHQYVHKLQRLLQRIPHDVHEWDLVDDVAPLTTAQADWLLSTLEQFL